MDSLYYKKGMAVIMKKSNKLKIYFFLITLLLLIFVGCSQDQNQNENDQNQTKTEDINYAPDFELETLNGESIKLSDLKGKKVIINFWATWCPYCVEEMPDLQKLYDKYKDEGLILLGIDVGESKSKVDKFIKDKNLNFTILLDEKSEVAAKYGINSLPATIAVDENGVVVGGRLGMMTYEQMELMYSHFNN